MNESVVIQQVTEVVEIATAGEIVVIQQVPEVVEIDVGRTGPQGPPGAVGPQGPAGPAGSASSALAGEAILAGAAVYLDSLGELRNALSGSLAHAGRVVGVAITSAVLGASASYVGEGASASVAHPAGSVLWVGPTAGILVSSPPVTGWTQEVGIVRADSVLSVALGPVIIRS
jgi:hypothetical protein